MIGKLRKYVLKPSRLTFLLIPVAVVWTLYLLTVHWDIQRLHMDKNYLRERIVELSKEYVKAIARERKEEALAIDGQSVVEVADMKQTTAVLLQNMLDRLLVLEKQVENVVAQSAFDISQLSEKVQSLNESLRNFASNFTARSVSYQCEIPVDPKYPECASKVKWLSEHWKSDVKYSLHGVNGSICSYIYYLSEVENFCPPQRKSRLANGDCRIPNNVAFPQCKSKVQWMIAHWQKDRVYSANGVNGSICSILIYLSEVETWCPMLAGRRVSRENDCKVPPRSAEFPLCEAKVAWMVSFWKTDPCYAKDFNVNGTICSFLLYLSEVESWCPKLPGRDAKQNLFNSVRKTVERKTVDLRGTSMKNLTDKLTNIVSAERLKWVRNRIAQMYSYWEKALKEMKPETNVTKKAVKKILVHIGVLAEEKLFHFSEAAGHGGPLGELVQWSDLITSLYVLGHDVEVTVVHQEMLNAISGHPGTANRPCPPVENRDSIDLIFTDYIGLGYLKAKLKGLFQFYQCRLRIVDSFGTEAHFNYQGPLPSIGNTRKIGKNIYGRKNLHLKQYMTMFPHSPDNTFLGFVVNSRSNLPKSVHKKQKALTYGKHYEMWKDLKNREFLDIIHENFEIHATTGGTAFSVVSDYLPPYVINHGVLSWAKLQDLLRESKIFIGIGFPYEGPAPLEAIAQGCFFLNPKFDPPKNRENTPFFGGKPTFRALTSQHPYAEHFIGEPQVLTVDINDSVAVKSAVKKIMDSEASPFLPFEYTHEGMLERVNALLHNQDFCASGRQWPPLSSRTVVIGEEGKSCKDVCFENGLICEPAYFEGINSEAYLKKAQFPCAAEQIIKRSSLVAPAYIRQENKCVLEAVSILYSCTAFHETVQRLCPCRDYRKGQVALCKTCY